MEIIHILMRCFGRRNGKSNLHLTLIKSILLSRALNQPIEVKIGFVPFAVERREVEIY
ncbi:hypothetical protein NV379_01960 [Paenibacillus sp. N1-5-1-14]|uniref:hypothetical protein n=1 Tax=Paenibacillus radicibacter TaxID=2972488 RepID=UPI002159623E|nr:hypothetical protein [Paenibacillus radicibacter]MCR8641410.1 hypothetical protein [Paenibacillus radicibacter]